MPRALPLSSFERFAERARGERLAGFALAKTITFDFPEERLALFPGEELRGVHSRGMTRFRELDASEESRTEVAAAGCGERASLLDVKAELARRLLAPCTLCALECRVDRTKGPAGACGLGPGLSRYLDFVHEGEEPEISPTHAILLSGCNYRCAYCSEWEHVDAPARDPRATEDELARSIEARRERGAASLSWIGGDPGVSLPGILLVLARARTSVPVVWNSNMHSTGEVRDLLEGIADAYVADWKHGNDACARAVARAPAHLETVRAAIARASREAFTIVRHLVLPGHVACCTLPVLAEIARDL
ncbi:radical SAM protein, partial [bacterium]|nr:radical SAM protein [bacterium]